MMFLKFIILTFTLLTVSCKTCNSYQTYSEEFSLLDNNQAIIVIKKELGYNAKEAFSHNNMYNPTSITHFAVYFDLLINKNLKPSKIETFSKKEGSFVKNINNSELATKIHLKNRYLELYPVSNDDTPKILENYNFKRVYYDGKEKWAKTYDDGFTSIAKLDDDKILKAFKIKKNLYLGSVLDLKNSCLIQFDSISNNEACKINNFPNKIKMWYFKDSKFLEYTLNCKEVLEQLQKLSE